MLFMERINVGFVKWGFYHMPINPYDSPPVFEVHFENGIICWYGAREDCNVELLDLFTKVIAHKHKLGKRIFAADKNVFFSK